MDPLAEDRELALKYLRGERHEELFAESPALAVVVAKSSTTTLKSRAKKHGVLKMNGQRGLTTTGGLKLLDVVGEDAKRFPSFDEVMA